MGMETYSSKSLYFPEVERMDTRPLNRHLYIKLQIVAQTGLCYHLRVPLRITNLPTKPNNYISVYTKALQRNKLEVVTQLPYAS